VFLSLFFSIFLRVSNLLESPGAFYSSLGSSEMLFFFPVGRGQFLVLVSLL
jgi:hypothetical protein